MKIKAKTHTMKEEQWISESDLNFKQMSHWSFMTEFINQEKDETTNIWRITRVRRKRDGRPTGNEKTNYYIGDTQKKYKTIQEVLSAYNNLKSQ